MQTGTKKELTYHQKELMRAAEKHDWTYGMSLKLSGSESEGKTIRVSEAQFKKLLKIFA